MKKVFIYVTVIGSLLVHAAYVFSSDDGGSSSYRSHGSSGSSWGGLSGGHK